MDGGTILLLGNDDDGDEEEDAVSVELYVSDGYWNHVCLVVSEDEGLAVY